MDPQPSSQLPTEPIQPEVEQTTAALSQETPVFDVSTVAQTEPQAEQEVEESTELTNEAAFSWQASEFIQHHKGLAWYAMLGLAVLIFVVIAALLKLWVGIALFLVMGVAIAVYAKKDPRVLSYELDSSGVTIEGKHYPYNSFRSFAVFQDLEWHSIELDPTQRFMPRLTLLFSDADIDAIADHLSLHLPLNDRGPDLIERITRRLRF